MVLRLLMVICLAALLALAGTALADAHGAANGYSVEATVTAIHPIGLVPGGLRMNGHFAGTITDGLFAGSSFEGVDYNLMRPDGVLVANVHMLIAIPDGPPVAVRIKGFWVPTHEFPPLEAFLDPEFEFPDIEIPGHMAVWHETMLPQYAHLNHTLFGFSGTLNLARGELRWTVRSLAE